MRLPAPKAGAPAKPSDTSQYGCDWPEGIGYWNYGMRYAFMYLLSHERATRRHYAALVPEAMAGEVKFAVVGYPRTGQAWG